MDQRQCKVCGVVFTPKQFNQIICSFQCRLKSNKIRSYAFKYGQKEAVQWKPYDIECMFCHKKFKPSNSSQAFHPICREIKKTLKGVFRYFQICPICKKTAELYVLQNYNKFPKDNNRDIVELFYSFKNWCETCKNKINENRRQKKPNKAEKFIHDTLKKYFPGDDIVFLDRRQIRYKGWWWEIDVYDRTKKIGFEYDDPRHDYSLGAQRNLIKDDLCKEAGIKLMRVSWRDHLTEQLILSKLKENGILVS